MDTKELERMTAKKHVPLDVTLRLVTMMFLQMMTFPVWFNTVVPYMRTLPGGERRVPFCGILMGIGIFASPIVCILADRLMDSGKVLAWSSYTDATGRILHHWSTPFLVSLVVALLAMILFAVFFREKAK